MGRGWKKRVKKAGGREEGWGIGGDEQEERNKMWPISNQENTV